jgi:phage I-like protein
MNALSSTRAGGDHGSNPRKLGGRAAIDTAGAPAHRDSRRARAALAVILEPGEPAPAGARGVEERRRSAEDAPAAPEWIELLPAGVFHGRDGRGPFRLDDPAAVIAATRALRMEAGIPVDYDHATDFAAPNGQPAPAAGWIRELQVRDGALWGRVEWTERAARAILAHEYRYISPVFQYSRADGKVIRLLRAGLTNNPNLYLTAICAAGDEEDRRMEQFDHFLSQLRQLLDTGPDASFDKILEATGNLLAAAAAARETAQNAAAADPARYVDVAELKKALTELNALRAERAHEKAEHAVNEAIRAGKLVPAQREWAVAYCAADPDGFRAFVARQPAMLAGEMLTAAPGAAHARAPEAGAMLSAVENAICSQLGVSPGEFASRKQGRADFLKIRDNSQREL